MDELHRRRSRTELRRERVPGLQRLQHQSAADLLHLPAQPEVLTPTEDDPMTRNVHRARRVIAGCLSTVVLVAACDRVKTELLAPQNPGLIDPSAVGSPTAALALRVGALGRYKQVQAGESIWQMGGTLADEYKNADFATNRINADQRILDPLDNWNYTGVTQSRGFIRDAIAAMKAFNPDSTALIGELYMELAFIEMTLADNYCNGIPLGHTINGVQTNGVPLTTPKV